MYHLPTSKCLQVFVGHESHGDGGGVTGGSFTPDGKFALTIGMDGTMRLWAPRTGVCKHVFKFHSDDGSSSYGGGDSGGMKGLTCLAVDGGLDGQLAIAGGEDGSAHVVHLQGKKVVAKLCHFDISQGGAGTTGAGNNASGGGGMAVDGDNEEEIMMISSVEAVGFAPKNVNPNWVATGGSDGKLKVWDLTFDGGQCRQTCEVKDVLSNDNDDSTSQNSSGGVTRLKWHPTLPIIIASYSDAAVRLWDARNGTLVHTLTGGGNSSNNENQINDISVEFLNTEQVQGGTGTGSAGSLIVVTGNDDGDAKVYNVDVGAVIAEAQGKSQS
jgi:WD40 repeat protein